MKNIAIKYALFWGAFMYAVMVFALPYINNEPITLKKKLLSIPIWFGGGLLQGYIIKRYNKPARQEDK